MVSSPDLRGLETKLDRFNKSSRELKKLTDEVFYPNRIKRDLFENGYVLMKYGIAFDYERRHSGRLIKLDYYPERDSSVDRSESESTVTQLVAKASQSS